MLKLASKMSKLPIILICSVIILFLIVGVSVVMFLINPEEKIIPGNNQIEEPLPPNSDATADWKIYRNEEIGIEFKYPKEYSINWAIDYHNPLEEKYYDPKSEVVFSLSIDPNIEFQWCQITISETNYDNIENWAENFLAESNKPYFHEGAEFPPPKIVSFENFDISDTKGKKIVREGALFCEECIDITAIKEGYYYIFGCSNSEGKFTQEEKLSVEGVLSTFRFLNEIE